MSADRVAASIGTQVQRLYGLRVRSELPLHQQRPAVGPGPVDVDIRLGLPIGLVTDLPPGRRLVLHEEDRAYYAFATGDDGSHILRFFGLCDFVVDPSLTRVRVHVVTGADPGLAAILAAGALLSFLLMMRGEAVLHASAVQVEDSALAFVGFSGMGKSTMAALMCGDGARLVTDDVLRVDFADGAARCALGATELRLRKAAGELSERFAAAPGRRQTSDARDALRATEATQDRLPLAAVVVPRPNRGTDRVEVTPVPAGPALLNLLRFPRILGWEDETVLAQQFQHLGRLVETVPVYVADVPWGPPFRDDIARSLLVELGLAVSPVAAS